MKILEGLNVTPGGKLIKKLPLLLTLLFYPILDRVSFMFLIYVISLSLASFCCFGYGLIWLSSGVWLISYLLIEILFILDLGAGLELISERSKLP